MKRFNFCIAALIPAAFLATATLTDVTVMTSPPDGEKDCQYGLSTKPYPTEKGGVMRKMPLPSKVASSLLLHEDFESVTGQEPYELPAKWVSIANPEKVDDKWMAGTLYDESGQLMGTSGEKYAFILPDLSQPHDAWMFSPAVNLENDNGYKLSFYSIMLANHGVKESLEVVLCKQPSPEEENRVSTLLSKQDDIKSWTYIETYINDIPEGTYYIGFHSNADANSGGLLIDDVMLTNVDAPVFLGASAINFESKYTTHPASQTDYEIWNNGYTPLDVKLESCSPEITVSGLPVTVEASEKTNLTITLDVNAEGVYEGEIVLVTNDPLSQKIIIPVRQTVMEVPMGNSKLHTFEDGTPYSIAKSNAIVNNLLGKGVDDSRTLFFRKDLSKTHPVVFYTDFVDLGQNPHFRMDYMLQKEKMMGTVIENMEADSPKLNIFITDDYGLTWTEVYRMGKGEEDEFDGSMDYHHVDIDLAGWKGKTCGLRMEWNGNASGSGLMDRANMGVCMDNLMLGTPYDVDLNLALLSGPTVTTPGASNEYTVTVANYGNSEVSAYSVIITDENGQAITEISGEPLKPYEKKNLVFNHSFANTGKHCVNARCVVSNDADESDNSAIPLYVSVLGIDEKALSFPEDEGEEFVWTMSLPVNFYAFTACNAYLYYANEIGINRATISSLEYDVKGSEYRSDLFRVYLVEADIDEFTDESEFPAYEEMTKVFEGRIHFLPGETKLIIPFDSPYDYKGKNLIVYTEHFGNEFVSGRFGKMIYSDKNRELAGDIDVVIDGRTEFPESKKEAKSRYAAVTFNVSEPAEGSVHGRVVGLKGEPVEGVKVYISGTSFYTLSDEDGSFSMPRIAVGEYDMIGEKAGYYDGIARFTVSEGDDAEIEIVISDVAKQTVSGKVTDLNGNPVSGSLISFDGKIPGRAVSDNSGLFSLELTGDSDYEVEVLSDYYTTLRTSIHVGEGPVNLTCTVDELKMHPYNPTLSKGDGTEIRISWEQPLIEMRHDTGEFKFELGYDYGYSEIIFGSAYHVNGIVKEVSWYMTDLMAHDDFHVYVFGLTDGEPDPEKILYHAANVDWADNTWNTHVLTDPVEADGFMVAVACTGFMCIGVTEADENYPYIENTEYYAGDSYRFHISEMATSSYKNNHWMLRAGIEKPQDEAEVSGPEIQAFKVFRHDDAKRVWEEIGQTTDLSYIDNLISLPSGVYRWGVEAEYGQGVSSRVKTESYTYTASGVDDLVEDQCSVTYAAGSHTLNFTGVEYIKDVRIYESSGKLVSSYGPRQQISTDDLPAGGYICVTYLTDGSLIITRFMK